MGYCWFVQVLNEADLTAEYTWVEVAKRMRGGVVCRFSALQLRRIGTQNPRGIRGRSEQTWGTTPARAGSLRAVLKGALMANGPPPGPRLRRGTPLLPPLKCLFLHGYCKCPATPLWRPAAG